MRPCIHNSPGKNYGRAAPPNVYVLRKSWINIDMGRGHNDFPHKPCKIQLGQYLHKHQLPFLDQETVGSGLPSLPPHCIPAGRVSQPSCVAVSSRPWVNSVGDTTSATKDSEETRYMNYTNNSHTTLQHKEQSFTTMKYK